MLTGLAIGGAVAGASLTITAPVVADGVLRLGSRAKPKLFGEDALGDVCTWEDTGE